VGGLTGLQLKETHSHPERARQNGQRGVGWQLEEWEERRLAEGEGGVSGYVFSWQLQEDTWNWAAVIENKVTGRERRLDS